MLVYNNCALVEARACACPYFFAFLFVVSLLLPSLLPLFLVLRDVLGQFSRRAGQPRRNRQARSHLRAHDFAPNRRCGVWTVKN